MRDLWWWLQESFVEVILVGLVVVSVVSVLWATLQPEPPFYSLTKTEWTCTETKVEKHVRLQPAGKVTIPISTSREVCVSYKRNY